jgi:hypothetical protein
MRTHLVLALAALTATASFAAEQETGNVVAHDAQQSTFTIETDTGNRIAFQTAATTRVTRDNAVVAVRDLVTGTRVRVTADEAVGTAPRLASRVEVMEEASAPGAGSATSGVDNTQTDTSGATDSTTARDDDTMNDNAIDNDRVDSAEDGRMASNDQLPRTATALPLIALLGSGALLAGLTVRSVRR